MKVFGAVYAQKILAITLGIALAGCTTLSGTQRPVTSFRSTDASVDMKEALNEISDVDITLINGSLPSESQRAARKRELRNNSIALYMHAADLNYVKFVGDLSKGFHSANLALEIGAGATAAVGSAVSNAASELAAATGFLAGSKSSLSKELYFEKTLPALIAAMETKRTRARTSINAHMKQSIDEYPLATAFFELGVYERAGDINDAIGELNQAAGKELAGATIDFDKGIRACAADPLSDDDQAAITNAVVAATDDQIIAALKSLNLTPSQNADAATRIAQNKMAIQNYRNKFCTNEEVQQVKKLLLKGN